MVGVLVSAGADIEARNEVSSQVTRYDNCTYVATVVLANGALYIYCAHVYVASEQ